MKNLSKPGFTLILLVFLLQSCSENNPVNVQKSAARISFNLEEHASQSSPIAGYDLLISVEDQYGNQILSGHNLSFTTSEDNFITEDLTLPPGTYVITDLRLENEEEVLYDVTESQPNGSQSVLASLPYRFTVSHDNTAPLIFKMKPAKAKRKFSLAVFIEGDNGLEYTSATAYLNDGDSTVATYQLEANTNHLGFNLDQKKEYTLTISKDGYNDVAQPFIYKDIKHNPINVTLTPVSNVVTMKGRTQFNGTDHVFQFQIWADPGAAITADFGPAGQMTLWFDELNPSYSFSLLNSGGPQEYNVTVTGDLDQVTEFAQDHGGLISEANLSGFTNVEQIHLAFHPLTSIDFSANTKVRFLYFYGMPTLTDFTLPTDHLIDDFNISGNTGLSAGMVDAAIDNIYANAISKNIVDGQISLSTEFYGGSEMLGPPSAASMTKLTELRDVHGWYIWPEF